MEIRIDKDGNVTDTIISPGIASGLERAVIADASEIAACFELC